MSDKAALDVSDNTEEACVDVLGCIYIITIIQHFCETYNSLLHIDMRYMIYLLGFIPRVRALRIHV